MSVGFNETLKELVFHLHSLLDKTPRQEMEMTAAYSARDLAPHHYPELAESDVLMETRESVFLISSPGDSVVQIIILAGRRKRPCRSTGHTCDGT